MRGCVDAGNPVCYTDCSIQTGIRRSAETLRIQPEQNGEKTCILWMPGES